MQTEIYSEMNCSLRRVLQSSNKMTEIIICPISPVTAVLVCILVTLLVSYFRNIYSVFDKLNIPGPSPKWVLGSIHEFQDKNPLDVFKEWRKKYGDIYGFFEGFQPSIVINDPEMARQVLVTHFDKFHVRPIYMPFIYYPDDRSLHNIYGDDWRQQRHVVSSAFNAVSMNHMVKRIKVTGDKLVSKLTDMMLETPQGFDISRILDRFTLDAFAYSGFDYNVDCMNNENAVLYRFMTEFNKSAAADNPIAGLCRVYRSLVPLLKPFDHKFRKVHIQHLAEIRKVISEQRQRLSNQTEIESCNNLLSQLMTIEYPEQDANGKVRKRRLTDEELVSHLNALIGGGLGTTNVALSFVLHQLAMNPEIQEQLYNYIIDYCGTEETPGISTLRKMTFIERIVQETLRLLPCAPGIARACTEDCEINSIHFKKGMVIRIMGCTLYSDPHVFPNPEVFDPDRFLPCAKDARHKSLFLPFGQGPRVCAGVKMAFVLVKIAIIKILQNFKVERCSQTIDPLPTALRPMLCPKNGVFVKLVRRS